MTVRRQLFTNSSPRRKLFALMEGTPKMIKCGDCGYEMESRASSTHVRCPKCGGMRFNVLRDSGEKHFSEYQYQGRISLFSERDPELEFQKNFSEPETDFEAKLKKYSGRVIPVSSCEKIFGVPAEDLTEKCFAEELGDGNLEISQDAFLKSKLFSKLIISVTKVMDLDPQITCSTNPIEDKIRAIRGLENSGSLCPKSIILIKKAHGIGPETLSVGSPSLNSWAEDSGILGDLRSEFGGSSLEYPSFKRTIEDRYPDAPTGILDLLKSRGIIRISGDRVNVL